MSSTNASPSAFGWDFQVNAGIVLLLMNIGEAESVKIEGTTEDVEITFANGQKVFAQAKSIFDPDDTSHAIDKLEGALKTLNNASTSPEAERLVYVTNSPNPFIDVKTMTAFTGSCAYLPYANLPQVCKDRIDTICTRQRHTLPRNNLAVLVFDFRGDGENRYRIVKEKVNELLAQLSLSDRGWGKQTLNIWHSEFGHNASQHDLQKCVTKKQMIWPLIVWLCEVGADDVRFNDCDESESNELLTRYKVVICDSAERFEFVTKVMTAYSGFEPGLQSKTRTDRFVSERWEDFKSEFALPNAEDSILGKIVKIAVHNVIKSRRHIDSVKKAVNL
jgi:hypothetical protein